MTYGRSSSERKVVHLFSRTTTNLTRCNRYSANPLTTERWANVTCRACLKLRPTIASSERGSK